MLLHEAARTCAHPNLVGMLDVTYGPGSGKLLGLVFPCIPLDLATHIRSEHRQIGDGRGVLAGLLPAIAHLHAQQIVHTDVKPPNILLERDDLTALGGHRVVLADLGNAVVTAPGCQPRPPNRKKIVQEGLEIGTPDYRAPEITVGELLLARVDEWACGLVGLQAGMGTSTPPVRLLGGSGGLKSRKS